MRPIDRTARSQSETLSFEFELDHAPEKMWRALTDPELLAEWLLPVVGLELEPGAAFTFEAPRSRPQSRTRACTSSTRALGRTRSGISGAPVTAGG